MMSHLIDYTSWYNVMLRAEWVMAQAAGRGKLTDIHLSPGLYRGLHPVCQRRARHFRVRGRRAGCSRSPIPGGANAASAHKARKVSPKSLTGGGWRAVTKDGVFSGAGYMNYDLDMPPYMPIWPTGSTMKEAVHPCNFEQAYEGFEIMMGLVRSAALGGQVALPLIDAMDEIQLLKLMCPTVWRCSLLRSTRRNSEWPIDSILINQTRNLHQCGFLIFLLMNNKSHQATRAVLPCKSVLQSLRASILWSPAARTQPLKSKSP